MRYFLAIVSLALGAVLMLLGLGQRTFLAEPTEVVATNSDVSEVDYAVISEKQLSSVEGTPVLKVPGDDVMIAYAKTSDIDAWLAPVGYTKLNYDAESKSLIGEEVQPEEAEDESADAAAPEWQNPHGSDLWVDETASKSKAGLNEKLQLKPGQSVLISSTKKGPIGTNVSVDWSRSLDTPWAGPLLAGGAILAVLGVILYILGVDHDRRGLGPRRGRRGALLGLRDSLRVKKKVDPRHPGVKSVVAGVGLTGALLLAGCSPSYWPQFQKQDQEQGGDSDSAASPVTDKQLERIVHQVSSTAIQADKKLDPEILKKRFAGDALKQRTANYKIRKSVDDYGVKPPFILDERLGYELIQSTDEWPRTIFVALSTSSKEPDDAGKDTSKDAKDKPATDTDDKTQTESKDTSPTAGLLLHQEKPQSNYEVVNIVNLRGGIEMPAAAPASEGTAVLADDIETLKIQPKDVGSAYATVLNKGKDDKAAELFDLKEDSVIDKGGVNWVTAERDNLEDQEGEATFKSTAKQSTESPLALSTGAGGALVFTTVTEERVATAEEGSELPVGKVVKAISGLSGKKSKIVQTVEHQLLFFVPNKSNDESAQLLGSTSELVGASE